MLSLSHLSHIGYFYAHPVLVEMHAGQGCHGISEYFPLEDDKEWSLYCLNQSRGLVIWVAGSLGITKLRLGAGDWGLGLRLGLGLGLGTYLH
jgi:hypothetical protein